MVGLDGATHQGAFDLSFIRCIPNMIIMTPSDEDIAWKMLNTGFEHEGPVAIRYPRGVGRGVPVKKTEDKVAIGKSRNILDSNENEIIILSFGSLLE